MTATKQVKVTSCLDADDLDVRLSCAAANSSRSWMIAVHHKSFELQEWVEVRFVAHDCVHPGRGDIGFANLAAGDEATDTLMRGFTAVRDAGGPAFGLKRAIDRGSMVVDSPDEVRSRAREPRADR